MESLVTKKRICVLNKLYLLFLKNAHKRVVFSLTNISNEKEQIKSQQLGSSENASLLYTEKKSTK